MQAELRQFIQEARFYKATVLRVAELLPAEDAALDELVAEIVREANQKAFLLVVIAALSRERRVDARHLVRGTQLLPEYQWFPLFVQLHGEVADHLLAAVEQTQLSRVCEAAALLFAAVWCEEQREGKLPERLIPVARKLARNDKLPTEAQAFLIALAVRSKDAGLLAVTKQWMPAATPEKWQVVVDAAVKLSETVLGGRQRPVLDHVQEKPSTALATGTTMRRAVARIGRNEPCPCGSGKKYKHCCHDKDQERLHRSTEVAGLTQEELQAQPETNLTAERLSRTGPILMERMDPAKIALELLDMYFVRLCAFNLFDCAAAGFEKLGYSEERKELWKNVLFLATRAGHKDSIRRLLKVYPDQAKLQDVIYTGTALLLAEDDPAELLKILDECVLGALQENTPEELEGIAIALMFSRFRALGILVGRGTLSILPRNKANYVFEEILNTRDKLNLSPDDPMGDILDQRFAEHEDDHKKESAELRKAQKNLNAKGQEVRQLKESLALLQKEIAHREQKRAEPAAEPVATPQVTDEQALKELRQKVEGLKSALKERHHERNDLRRELQKAHTDLETLRQTAAPSTPELPDREDDLLLPQDAAEVQPVRLIEFPKGFQQTLAGFPRHVARAAIIMSGRLAAGELAAFVGAVRLKACPAIMRQRIGIDFRLLFRLLPDRVQVVDLISRQDLERKIKTLT